MKSLKRLEFADNASEDPDSKISNLFDDIEEKPSFEAVRIGESSEDSKRLVKIRLASQRPFTEFYRKRKSEEISYT